jgi:hypothetical protein
MWRMRDAYLPWLLWSQSFKIGILPTNHLLCTCFHNNFILCKISHMQTILSNCKELAIDIVMMARQYAFCIFWASFCRSIYVLLQNWMIVLWATKLCFHGVGIFYPFLTGQCHGFIFLLLYLGTTCEFVGHLFWNGQFQGFNSPTSASVCYKLIWYALQKSCLHFAMCVQYALHSAYSHALNSTIWEK